MPSQLTLPTTNTLVLSCYCHFYLKRHFPILGRPVEPKPTLWLELLAGSEVSFVHYMILYTLGK